MCKWEWRRCNLHGAILARDQSFTYLAHLVDVVVVSGDELIEYQFVGVGHWPLLVLAGALTMDCPMDGDLLPIFQVIEGFFLDRTRFIFYGNRGLL